MECPTLIHRSHCVFSTWWCCGYCSKSNSALTIEKGRRKKQRQRSSRLFVFGGKIFIQFLAALANSYFASVDLEAYRMIYQIDRGKPASEVKNWKKSTPQTDETTFAFASPSYFYGFTETCPVSSWETGSKTKLTSLFYNEDFFL